jgi:hypothetical protein
MCNKSTRIAKVQLNGDRRLTTLQTIREQEALKDKASFRKEFDI